MATMATVRSYENSRRSAMPAKTVRKTLKTGKKKVPYEYNKPIFHKNFLVAINAKKIKERTDLERTTSKFHINKYLPSIHWIINCNIIIRVPQCVTAREQCRQ